MMTRETLQLLRRSRSAAEIALRYRRRRRLDHTADRGQTTHTLLRFFVRHLAIRFYWRVVSILGWLATGVRIFRVALQRTARATGGVRRACFGLFADRAATHHH